MTGICRLFLLLLCFLEGGVRSLRNLSIAVPRAVLAGEGHSASLRCSYDLEGAALYSIRWYRDEYEFYRYVPRELPPTMVFPLPGATVDLTLSDDHQVFIVNMDRRLSGVYLCEVSADAPLFHTDIRSAPLAVVEAPRRPPRLSLSRLIYARNDVLRANCSVDEAYPAPNVTWVLDDDKVAETTVGYTLDLDFKERGVLSQLEITIRGGDTSAPRREFSSEHRGRSQSLRSQNGGTTYMEHLKHATVPPRSGQLTVSCVATIFDVYVGTSETVRVKEDDPRPASATREHSSGDTTSGNLLFLCICVGSSLLDRLL